VTLAWTIRGGTSLTVVDGSGATVCSTTDPVEIEEGACALQVSEEGSFQYTLTVANSLGEADSATVTVITSTGPRLLAFSGSTGRITVGEAITFAWQVQDDPFGETPTLSLTDGITTFDLSDANPNQGSKSFAIQNVGELTFVFTASTAAGAKTAIHQAKVYGAPTATLVASPTIYDWFTPVTLSWTSEHADASLVLYRLDGQGDPVELYAVPEAERAAGSIQVEPSEATTYRIVATNGLGVTASAQTRVSVAPPTILSFEAEPGEVVEGEEVTLSWTTRLATHVELDIPRLHVVELDDAPFVDIRTLGATSLAMTNGCGQPSTRPSHDNGCGLLTFPAGFTFPFAGTEYDSAVVFADGFLGFVPGEVPNPHDNKPLPFPNPAVDLLPFWDDLIGTPSSFHYLHGEDAEGQYLVIQWADMDLGGVGDISLEFQTWLRDDGSFEFRYGSFDGSSCRLLGTSATVGFQYPDASLYYVLHFGAAGWSASSPMPGGFAHRSWRFVPHDLPDLSQLPPNGSFTFVPKADADVRLTARGAGGESEETVTITVHPRVRLAVVGPTEKVEAGHVFTLSWTSQHANSVVVVDTAGNAICTAAPEEVAAAPDGQSVAISRTVRVRTFHIALAASATQVAPGTPVTFTWNVTSLTGETPVVTGNVPLVEVTDGSAAFEDISTAGLVPIIGPDVDGTLAAFAFPAGFTFPFLGERYDAVLVSEDGFVSFDEGLNTPVLPWPDRPLPDPQRPDIHLAPFLDDLHTQPSGAVYADFRTDPDRVIIQWSHVSRWSTISNRTWDLNFQVVLFADGTFEYRYGTMDPPANWTANPLQCPAGDCVAAANGSSATIGYQRPGGSSGFTLHLGDEITPFPGGLVSRSFRLQGPPAGSVVVTANDDVAYTICAFLGGGFHECKTVTIRAPWEILSFSASSRSIAAGQTVALSWQTVNADGLALTANGQPVDLSGKKLGSDSIVLAPTETTTYTLTMTSLGRTRSRSVVVEVRKVDLAVTPPAGPFDPGQTISVDVDVDAHVPGTTVVYGPMHEVFAPFVDIRTDPNAVQLVGGGQDDLVVDHPFAGGFAFPDFGQTYTSVRVSTDGYLSFEPSTTTSSNQLRRTGCTSPPSGTTCTPGPPVVCMLFWRPTARARAKATRPSRVGSRTAPSGSRPSPPTARPP